MDVTYACPHCPKMYVRSGMLETHMRRKHKEEYTKLQEARKDSIAQAASRVEAPQGAESLPETDPNTSKENMVRGSQVVNEIAKQLRDPLTWTDSVRREKLARDLEGVGFACNFVLKDLEVTDYWAVKEKAQKWDKLVELLPTVESFLKLAIETEAKRVQAPDHDRGQ